MRAVTASRCRIQFHIDEIYQKAQELGLELCPAEVGPNLRLKYTNQPLNEWIIIAMKKIPGRDGRLSVFSVARNDSGFWLDSSWTKLDSRWDSDCGFVFRSRKLES